MDVPVRGCRDGGPRIAFVWGAAPCVCAGGGEFRLNWLLRGESVLYPLPSAEEPPKTLPDPPQHSSLPFSEVLSLFGSPGEKKKTVLYR